MCPNLVCLSAGFCAASSPRPVPCLPLQTSLCRRERDARVALAPSPKKPPIGDIFTRAARDATRREYATTAPPAAAHHPPPRAPLARPDLTSAAAANGVRRPADLPRHRQRPPVSEPTHPTIGSFDPAAACFYPCPFPIRPRGLHWWWCCARALCLALG